MRERANNVLQGKDGQGDVPADIAALQKDSQISDMNFRVSDGKTGAHHTPAENLLILNGNQQIDYNNIHGMAKVATGNLANGMAGYEWTEGADRRLYMNSGVIKDNASFFENAGCIKNGDGSYTNPNNGSTYVEVEKGTWLNTSKLDDFTCSYDQGYTPMYAKEYLQQNPSAQDTFNRTLKQGNVAREGQNWDKWSRGNANANIHIGTDQRGKRYLY